MRIYSMSQACADLLERCATPDFTLGQIAAWLVTGHAQLFVHDDQFAIVSQISNTPNYQFLSILQIAGDWHDDTWQEVEQYARSMGIETIRGLCRVEEGKSSRARLFSQRVGAEITHVIVEKKLCPV